MVLEWRPESTAVWMLRKLLGRGCREWRGLHVRNRCPGLGVRKIEVTLFTYGKNTILGGVFLSPATNFLELTCYLSWPIKILSWNSFFFFFLIMTRREKGQFLSGTGPVSSLFSNLQRKWVWDTRPDQQIEVILESLVPFVPEAKLTYLFFFLTYTFLGLSRLQRKNLFLSKQAWVWFL